MSEKFEAWLGRYLKANHTQVSVLVKDRLAVEFLMSWSIFESDCFDGFCKVADLKQYSKKVAESSRFERQSFESFVTYFHQRYQDKAKLKKLLHSQKINQIEKILAKKTYELTQSEEIFLLLVVVYRYRNIIFHGNKGVSSWLAYKEQIKKCCHIMHQLVDISDTAHNKLKHADAA